MIAILFVGCKKVVQIDPPTNSITTTEVFKDSADANAAVLGIYSAIINTTNPEFTSGAITLYAGSSADELVDFMSIPDYDEIYTNSVLATNGATYSDLWAKAYSIIYQANACIEGLVNSNGVSQTFKSQLIGEAKFIRALCYFYLVNLFGDVPYVTSTSWAQSSLAVRMQKNQIYQNILADLADAQGALRTDYSISGGQRVRANWFAATALLARVNLFLGDYVDAEKNASAVINNSSTYNLASNLNDVFLANSTEAILQWAINPTNSAIANLTPEGRALIPANATDPPTYFLNDQLLNGFEPGDNRRVAWIDSTNYSGSTYYYPYKYKIGVNQGMPNGPASEYYMVLRLAEQYLIRAEAKAQQGTDLNGAIGDLNMIRERAGLTDLPSSLTAGEILKSVAQERKVELFAEWGHRWLDLKRTGQVDAVMSIVTPQKNGGSEWKSYQQLYPIPYVELTKDPNLTQNPGY